MKKSPLPRGTSQLKRTTLRKQSAKHAAHNERARNLRALYRWQFHKCFICRFTQSHYPKAIVGAAVEIHHIAGRNAKRPDKYEVAANWLPICRACHDTVTDSPVQTAEIVWQAKQFCDPTTANLEVLKRLNPRRFRNLTP